MQSYLKIDSDNTIDFEKMCVQRLESRLSVLDEDFSVINLPYGKWTSAPTMTPSNILDNSEYLK